MLESLNYGDNPLGLNDGQWLDYSGGLIFGYRFNKSLGVFLEGKYHKYWDRTWYDFLVGMNYVIF